MFDNGQRKLKILFLLISFLVLVVFILFFSCASTLPRRFATPEQKKIAARAEKKALERGRKIYFNTELGSNGRSCHSCHPAGKMTNAQSYPRYKHIMKTMATISMTHNFAVVNESRGEAWILGSEDANAIALYVQFLANGKPLRMAGPNNIRDEWIERGKFLFKDTGLGTNGKSCESCHIQGGSKSNTDGHIAPALKGVTAVYPQYSFDHHRVITLEQRINSCITKKQNGTELLLNDEKIVALYCYLAWISKDFLMSVARIDKTDLD